jgi:hypothetical protein
MSGILLEVVKDVGWLGPVHIRPCVHVSKQLTKWAYTAGHATDPRMQRETKDKLALLFDGLQAQPVKGT